MLTFGSLFAGIGGIDLGFERCGMECRWQVEIDPYATKVLEKHWPGVNRWGDVKTFPPDDDEKWKVDVIAGGFPCQDLSHCGTGRGLNGERSGLFFEIIRVARQLRPRAIVLENVPALLNNGMATVLRSLAEVGYNAEWHCVSARSVGANHKRERLFIIATLANASSKRQQRQGLHGERIHQAKNKDRKASRIVSSCEGKKGNWDAEPELGRVAHGIPDRMDRLKCLGNAVVPQVAEVVANRLFKIMEKQ